MNNDKPAKGYYSILQYTHNLERADGIPPRDTLAYLFRHSIAGFLLQPIIKPHFSVPEQNSKIPRGLGLQPLPHLLSTDINFLGLALSLLVSLLSSFHRVHYQDFYKNLPL